MKTLPPIHKAGVRIWRPSEFEKLYAAMKSNEKPMLAGTLCTGARFVENQQIQQYREWWDGRNFIALPSGAVLKVKVKIKERYIRLSEWGRKAMPMFLNEAYTLPSLGTWDWILKERCKAAGLAYEGPRTKKVIKGGRTLMLPEWSVSAKSTRKTWESWLVSYYGEKVLTRVQINQGHDSNTQVKHYLQDAFYPEDKNDMGKYVNGWSELA